MCLNILIPRSVHYKKGLWFIICLYGRRKVYQQFSELPGGGGLSYIFNTESHFRLLLSCNPERMWLSWVVTLDQSTWKILGCGPKKFGTTGLQYICKYTYIRRWYVQPPLNIFLYRHSKNMSLLNLMIWFACPRLQRWGSNWKFPW